MLPLPRGALGALVSTCVLGMGLGACGLVASLGGDYSAASADAGVETGRVDGNGAMDASVDTATDATVDTATDATDATIDTNADTTADSAPDTTMPDGPDDGGHLDEGDAPAPPSFPPCGDAGACVPALPSGQWAGPLAVYTGSGPPPTACGTGYNRSPTLSGGVGPDASAQPICTCTCSPSAVVCPTTAAYTLYGDTTCSSPSCGAGSLALNSTCQTVTVETCADAGAASFSLVLDPVVPSVSPTMCPMTSSSFTPGVTWAVSTTACSAASTPTQETCGPGAVCAPIAASPFMLTCIQQTGDVQCPGPPYAQKLLVQGANDPRGCTPCTCGPASPGTCTVTVEMFASANQGCKSPVYSGSGASCVSPSPLPWTSDRDFELTTSPVGGICQIATGGPNDAGVTFGPVTLCCIQ